MIRALLTLTCLLWAVQIWAFGLSVNETRFASGDTLTVELDQRWSSSEAADVYVGVMLPMTGQMFYYTPQGFMPDMQPFASGAAPAGNQEILSFDWPAGMPLGEYTFYAVAIRSNTIFEYLSEVETASVVFTDPSSEPAPAPRCAEGFRYADGVAERVYSQTLELEQQTGAAPFSYQLSEGSLPNGLSLDGSSGLIQGTPTGRGMSAFTVQVTDSQGNQTDCQGAIKVYGILTFGESGTFKGCNGLQMALNAVQDLDEIRIQQGTYDCVGLELAENKEIPNGIKISGGWDASFENQTVDPDLTVFDAGNHLVDGVDSEELCNNANGVWHRIEVPSGFFAEYLGRCYQKQVNIGQFFVFKAGPVNLEALRFQNALGGAVDFRSFISNNSISDSAFDSNTATHGGAVHGKANISHSTFSNNMSGNNGGAVYGSGNITQSTFNNNTAYYGWGGAIYATTRINISHSTFNNNMSEDFGGAIYGGDYSNISNSIFSGNAAQSNGGAVYSADDISHSTFIGNTAENGGAVANSKTIINSLFIGNSAKQGSAIYTTYYSHSTVVSSTLVSNSATEAGGGFYGQGTILNSIFHENTVGSEANDITRGGDVTLDYSLVNYIDGAVDYGIHNIMGDPKFVDAVNGDYRLSADSPALDIGDSSVLDNYEFAQDDQGNPLDLDNKPRVSGANIDMGAFER